MIAGLEDGVIGERIEIVFPVNQPAQASEDDFEEWIQRFKNCVFGFFYKGFLGI